MNLRAAVVVAIVAATRVAHAEDDLKQRADEQMRTLHYREALDLYDRAYASKHDPAILYNRARAEQGLGDYPAALDAIEEFARVAPEELKAKVRRLDQLIEEIRSQVALVIVKAPAGATVMVDGKAVGTTPLPGPLRVTAGTVSIAVEAPGARPFHADVKTTGGKLETVNAVLTPEVAPGAPNIVVDSKHFETYTPAGYRVATYALGAVGLAGLAAAGTFAGLVAWKTGDASPHCPGKACDAIGWNDVGDARTFATLADVGFVVGGACLATSIVMFIVAPKHRRELAVMPIAGLGFFGLRGSL